jgi:hypothetical protein
MSMKVAILILAGMIHQADWTPWFDDRPGAMYEHGGFRNDCESLPRRPCGELHRDDDGQRWYGPGPDSGGEER